MSTGRPLNYTQFMDRAQRIGIIQTISNLMVGIDPINATVILREHGWARYGFLGEDVQSNRQVIIDFLSDCEDDVLQEMADFLEQSFHPVEPIVNSGNSATRPKLFITHLDTHRQIATQIKDALEVEGIRGFVAHEDIQDNALWRSSIKEELKESHGLLVIVTEGIENSVWCQQEIGWAMSRGIPLMAINFLSRAPNLGFLSDYQFINYGSSQLPEIVGRVLPIIQTNPAVIPLMRANLIQSFIHSYNFNRTRTLWQKLNLLGSFTASEKADILQGFESNNQLGDAEIDGLPAREVVREYLERN